MSYQDYPNNVGSQSQKPSDTPNPVKQQSNNQKLTVFLTSFSVVIVFVIGAFALGLNNSDDDAKAEQVANESSIEYIEDNRGTDGSTESQGDLIKNPNEEPDSTKIEQDRVSALNFVNSDAGQKFEEFIETSSFAEPEIQTLRQSIGDQAIAAQVPIGKKLKINIDYSSIGDQDFDNATLYIKLSKGLSVEAGSIKDSFNGTEINVQDSVYDASTNVINYGPGSSREKASPLKIGERGTLTLILNISPEANDNEVLASYLKQEGGKIGQPSIFFVDINK
jgi:hypothetical protein